MRRQPCLKPVPRDWARDIASWNLTKDREAARADGGPAGSPVHRYLEARRKQQAGGGSTRPCRSRCTNRPSFRTDWEGLTRLRGVNELTQRVPEYDHPDGSVKDGQGRTREHPGGGGGDPGSCQGTKRLWTLTMRAAGRTMFLLEKKRETAEPTWGGRPQTERAIRHAAPREPCNQIGSGSACTARGWGIAPLFPPPGRKPSTAGCQEKRNSTAPGVAPGWPSVDPRNDRRPAGRPGGHPPTLGPHIGFLQAEDVFKPAQGGQDVWLA